jgi:hypothetical protein
LGPSPAKGSFFTGTHVRHGEPPVVTAKDRPRIAQAEPSFGKSGFMKAILE